MSTTRARFSHALSPAHTNHFQLNAVVFTTESNDPNKFSKTKESKPRSEKRGIFFSRKQNASEALFSPTRGELPAPEQPLWDVDGFLDQTSFVRMGHNHLTIRTFMAITAERDAAIRERNMALEETKRAFAELDMAMLQRDAAMAERNAAIQERDEAITSLRFQDKSMKWDHQEQEHTFADLHAAKPRRSRQKSQKVCKRMGEGEVSNGVIDSIDFESDEDEVEKVEDDSGLNRISFDDSAMSVPVCTCTGSPQPCYRWGNGGWQSACCTTTISMYPLPQMANKRCSRVGGRKMSGGAFGKLVSRLGSEGYDFSGPLDLKDHWSKHGTNRYSTLK